MKLILRIMMTWAMAFALVLVVIDVIKSFSAEAVVFTSIGDIWQSISATSFEAAFSGLAGRMQAAGGEALAAQIFAVPGWALFFAIGLLLMLVARPAKPDTFIKTR